MTHRAKCNVWMRKYLKAMNKNFVIAFGMGYEDGLLEKSGRPRPSRKWHSPGRWYMPRRSLRRRHTTKVIASERRKPSEST